MTLTWLRSCSPLRRERRTLRGGTPFSARRTARARALRARAGRQRRWIARARASERARWFVCAARVWRDRQRSGVVGTGRRRLCLAGPCAPFYPALAAAICRRDGRRRRMYTASRRRRCPRACTRRSKRTRLSSFSSFSGGRKANLQQPSSTAVVSSSLLSLSLSSFISPSLSFSRLLSPLLCAALPALSLLSQRRSG